MNFRIRNFKMLVCFWWVQFTSLQVQQNLIIENQHKKTILLITGAFVVVAAGTNGNRIDKVIPWLHHWPHWRTSTDFTVRQPDSLVLDWHYKFLDYRIDALPEKPILIGHSFGGLIVQLLVQLSRKRFDGCCLSISSAKGVLTTKFSFIRHCGRLWSISFIRWIISSFLNGSMRFTLMV
jgi:hypothetical protein